MEPPGSFLQNYPIYNQRVTSSEWNLRLPSAPRATVAAYGSKLAPAPTPVPAPRADYFGCAGIEVKDPV
jgi:hypothetical protein